MKRNITPNEIELLSSYLDHQLDSGRRLRLEERLRIDPDLRAAYQDLRQTRALLRSLPHLKAPRSFTLTPEMVGQVTARPAPRRIYPAFQFASALASILLVVVLVGDFLGFGTRATQALPPEQPRMTMEQEAPAAEQQELMKAMPTGTPAVGADMRAQTQGAVPTGEAESPMEAFAVPAPGFTATLTTTLPLSTTAPLVLDEAVTPEAGVLASGQPAEVEEASEAAPSWPVPERSLWRAAEVSLAVAALASALAAVYFRRRYAARG